MKRKDLSEEARAWEDFKVILFNSGMVAFGLGGLTAIYIKDSAPFVLLFILVHPISFFVAWRLYSKKFLKDSIKP